MMCICRDGANVGEQHEKGFFRCRDIQWPMPSKMAARCFDDGRKGQPSVILMQERDIL